MSPTKKAEAKAEETKKCPHCAEDIKAEANKCKHCGEFLHPRPHAPQARDWNPDTAAILSFFFPGVGQMYKGDVGLGLLFLLGVPVGYLLLVLPGIALHVYAVYNACMAQPSQRRSPHAP